MKKPPATPVEEVLELYHGEPVVDPYLWLEDGASERVREWTAAQNAYTREYLDRLPGREKLRERVTQNARLGMVSSPVLRKGRLFYTRRTKLQNQAVLFWREELSGSEKILVDPNEQRADGTMTLDWWLPSPDGKKVVYGLSTDGSEMSTLYVLDVETGQNLPDTIPYTRYASISWMPDGNGFFYTRYPKPGSVPPGQEHYNRRVFYHELGNDPTEDRLIFGEGRKPEEYFGVYVSPDGHYLLITASRTFDIQDVYLCDLQNQDGFTTIVENLDAAFGGEILGDTLYLRTNWQAPNYRVMSVNLNYPLEPWKEVLPERPHLLESCGIVGNKLVCVYLENANSHLRVLNLQGKLENDIPLPGIGTVGDVSGEWDTPDLFFSFTSFATPPIIFHYHIPTREQNIFTQVKADIDPSRYEVKQVQYPSKDGTQVTMFLVYQKGSVPNKNTPTLLTGYGGFNISRTPEFLGSYLALIEAGCTYALPNLRGGGEYGEEWHKAGMLGKKQNVFDDFISAAEYLIAQGYTRAEKLAIIGGSNGGLLVGAALTQRPELFRAVVCQVPLLDMLRYHRFLIARTWIPEYGSSEDPAGFRWLASYSPYHQVKPGTPYPAVLLMTAESDTRVDPLHARKMAAHLQAATSSDQPILLRLEAQAGHGIGKPTSKRIEEGVDFLSFVCAQLGVEIEYSQNNE